MFSAVKIYKSFEKDCIVMVLLNLSLYFSLESAWRTMRSIYHSGSKTQERDTEHLAHRKIFHKALA